MRIPSGTVASIVAALAALSGARAEFVPGRVYISAAGVENCVDPGPFDNDRIFQYDPITGSMSLFTIIPDGLCGGVTGLAFTPDGAYLRASSYLPSAILQVDTAGNVGVALGSGNGIAGPLGSNNVDHGSDSSFYVVNFSGQ
ncbi:MAG TPA: hypothetical protein VGM03_02320, partial [Phycisphaerae bacterium]